MNENLKIVIYGAGEHTLKLLELTDLPKKNIQFIIDSYKTNFKVNKYEVKKPEKLKKLDVDIVIVSSFRFQNEIVKYLKDKLNFNGKFITLYNENGFEPFYQV
ncbi:hypothetical protein [Iocasia frigidifontis]|uniref:hypothetical protein n=1 Tax=Iocasia fonsfrigidae TaxID=2682810 RepID=UPI0022A90D04|nr:hypothetical protein [Iocasia fonsfrigidae]